MSEAEGLGLQRNNMTEQEESDDVEGDGDGDSHVARTSSNSITFTVDVESSEGEEGSSTTLRNFELRRTNRHTFNCSWSMLIFTLIPLVIILH